MRKELNKWLECRISQSPLLSCVPVLIAILLTLAALGWPGKLMVRWAKQMHPGKNKSVVFQAEKSDYEEVVVTADELGFADMGEVVPCMEGMDEQPGRNYKFAEKYNLTMGLVKTNINTITQIDAQTRSRLAIRTQILADHPEAVSCLPTTAAETAAEELYVFLVTHYLPQRYPTIYTKSATHLHSSLNNITLPLSPPRSAHAALRLLVPIIDEDFQILLPNAAGDMTLSAYVWCYPAGFDPKALLGKTLAEIHTPVPGYAAKLRASMERWFTKLAVGSVWERRNWSVTGRAGHLWDSDLSLHDHGDGVEAEEVVGPAEMALRVEKQTLFRLPGSGARVMSLHLFVYPLEGVRAAGHGDLMADAVEGLVKGNVPEMRRYKRAGVWGDDVVGYLRS